MITHADYAASGHYPGVLRYLDPFAGEVVIVAHGSAASTVRMLEAERYADALDDAWTDRESYWRRAAQSLVTVCVPGADNHHLDRGQHQLLGLGVCTVSPDIFMATLEKRPVAGEHYVACRDDYADLIERIEWCRQHRQECRQIGRQAAQLFQAHIPRKKERIVGGSVAGRHRLY